jgi:phytoene dehydrogenase-like protein
MGLEYLQRPMWIAPGGLGGFLDDVADQLRERGVDLRTRRRALGVARTTHGYRVQTDDGPLDAEAVVLNLTHWDAARLCEGALADAFGRELRWHDKAWSAACLYVAVDDVLDRGRTPYHQIVLDRPLPVSGARSIFATLSTPGDALFAPEGQRTITASIHLDPARFAALEGERLAEEKRALEAEMYQALVAHFPELATTSPRLVRLATPSTWQSFAGRWQGRVGGLPWNHRTLLLGYPTGRTRTATLARVGDTVFPGQSVVAVAWGARRVASQLLEA